MQLLLGARAALEMQDGGGGWKSLRVGDARAGDDYAFRLPDGLVIPDPASRFQPQGMTGRSRVIDPRAYDWRDGQWRGRDWSEAVIYEAHVGAATRDGTYSGARAAPR